MTENTLPPIVADAERETIKRELSRRYAAALDRATAAECERDDVIAALAQMTRERDAAVAERDAAKKEAESARNGFILEGMERKAALRIARDAVQQARGAAVLQDKLDAAVAREARLREALEWYAEPVLAYAITQEREPRSAVHADGGKRARTALNDGLES